MSADKHRSRDRQLKLLKRAGEYGIPFHCKGGMAMKNPDVKKLIAAGLMVFVRRGNSLDKKRTTRGLITPDGIKFLRQHNILLEE